MQIKNNLITIALLLSTLLSNGQTWPFRDANSGILRGNITGVVGEFRADGTNARFHGGVDFTSPLPVTVGNNSLAVPNSGRAVFSMHAGTATVIYSPSDCWNSYVRISLQDGSHVYYKHIKPSTTNPITNQTVLAIADGTQVQPGTFLGVMFGDVAGEGDCSVHVHINQNNGSGGTLQGSTNFINHFVDPFNDTERPEFFYPFSGGGAATDNSDANGYRIAEFRRNGHTKTNTTDQLGESVRIDGTIHKSAYGKVDIISRLRDIHIGLNGGRRPDGDGNSGINGASYEILDNTGRTVAAEVQNLNFNSVPSNDNGNYVFDSRSNNSNHVYIITNNPTAANGRYDQFWNSGLRIGQTEDWNLTSRGEKDARSIQEAAYPDSKYLVRIRAKDIINFNGDAGILIRDVPTIIDNFLPYVKEIIVRQNIGSVVYHGVWNWDAATGQLTLKINDKPNDALPLGKLWIKVITSEPMKTLKLTVSGNDIGPIYIDPTPVANTNNMEFIKEYGSLLGSGRQTITIAGTDLADNVLLSNPSQNSLRLSNGTWPTSVTQGLDTNHGFTIGTSTCASNFPGGRTDGTTCLYVEYSVSKTNVTTNEPVVFTPIVSGTGTITYNWNFGTGASPATASTAGPHTVVYSTTGTKTVLLTVTDASGTKSKSSDVTVSTNGSSVDFSATPISGNAPLTVYYSDRSAGSVSSRSWTFPGGTPSSSTSPNPTVVYNIPGNYDASLTINGSSSVTKQSIIAVNSAPPVSASISHCNNYYFVNCASGAYNQYQQVFFTPTITGGSPLFSYKWNFGDGNTSTTQNPVNTYSLPGTYLVTFTVTDRNGATATTSASISILSISPSIAADFNASDTFVSTGEGPVIFTDATISNLNQSSLTYYWDFGADAYPRYAYTKGPHSVCYDNRTSNKTVFLRVHDPVTYTTSDKRKVDYVFVDKGNVSQCSKYTSQWITTAGAAAGASIQTCLFPGPSVGINNGGLSSVTCDLYKERSCVFNATTPCFGDPWYQSHGDVSAAGANLFRLWAGAAYSVDTKLVGSGSEGIYYQHPQNFVAGKRYVFTFNAAVDLASSSGTLATIDHLKVSLTNGLLPNTMCSSTETIYIYELPSYVYSLHELGSFEYAVKSSQWYCYEVSFYAPNNLFNQIWIYPSAETSLVSRSSNNQRDMLVMLTDFSLRSNSSGASGPFCADNLFIKAPSSGLAQASATVTTQGAVTIPNGQTTSYIAGQSVSLKPGFIASSGSIFKASIGACGTTGGRYSPTSFDDFDLFKQDYLPSEKINNSLNEPSYLDSDEGSSLAVVPNPAYDKITVSTKLKSKSLIEITIVSVIGVVTETRVLSDVLSVNEEFNISTLSQGIYFVKMKSNEKTIVKKFIKL
jgi:PKD repeat protein